MLKARVITASLLFPLAVIVILNASTALFAMITGIVFSLAAWEWTKLIRIQNIWLRVVHVLAMILFAIYAYLMFLSLKTWHTFTICLAVVASIFWLCSIIAICKYPAVSFLTKRWVGICVGWLMLLPSWSSLVAVHLNLGPIWVLLLCALVWSADIGAYCCGKMWGKKKLLPLVSAGKTWVGVFGAFVFAAVTLIIFTHFHFGWKYFVSLCVGSFVVVLFSIIGDLVESIFKRLGGCKDSGALLPGHGGVLDRIDGLLAAAPVSVIAYVVFIIMMILRIFH